MSRRRIFWSFILLGILVFMLGALLPPERAGSDPVAVPGPPVTAPSTTRSSTTTTSSTTSTTTTTVAPAPEPAAAKPASPVRESRITTREAPSCPPDPGIPGVAYRCQHGPVVAPAGAYNNDGGGHGAMWYCHDNETSGPCQGAETIVIDVSRGDPACALRNELYNRQVGRQVDPHGACGY